MFCGLYIPQEGQLLLDGAAVTDDSRGDYRDLFSAVFSDFHLFNRLIGPDEKEHPSTDQAQTYLSTLGLEDKVQIEGLGYSTTTALSYGQQKRLALVCAYEDRPIYLLDEWAADQDPPFKRFFYEELLPDLKRRGKTILIITHDDQYFQLADRIIKLADGCIVSDVKCAVEGKRA